MHSSRASRRQVSACILAAALMFLLSMGGATAGTATLPVITYQYGSVGGPPRDVAEVNAAINKLLVPQGFQVQLKPIDYNSYGQKMQLQFAAGQPCDLVWTSYFNNDFNQLVANGELLPLETLLPKYAPALWRTIPHSAWKAVTFGGHIYAAINQQVWEYVYGAIFRTSALRRFKIDLNKIKTWTDLTPIFAKMKGAGVSPIIYSDSASGYPPHGAAWPFDSVSGFDTLIGDGGIADVRYNDKSLHVFNPVTTAAFRAGAELAYTWRQAGYYTKDEPPPAVASAAAKAGRYEVTLDQHIDDSEYTAYLGGTWKGKNLEPLFLTTNGIQTTLTGVCKSSKDPVDAVKFINDLNGNRAIYMLITHGIEGKHWVWKDKRHDVIGYPKGVTATNSGYNPTTDWMFGNRFNAPYIDEGQVGLHDTWKEWNHSPASVALGFVVNAKPITSQLAQLATVSAQCEDPLLLGHVDPAKGIPACIKAMNDAGEGKVLAEIQRQLRAWKAHNH